MGAGLRSSEVVEKGARFQSEVSKKQWKKMRRDDNCTYSKLSVIIIAVILLIIIMIVDLIDLIRNILFYIE